MTTVLENMFADMIIGLQFTKFPIGHKFTVSDEPGQTVVTAKRLFRNPKTTFLLPKYDIEYLSHGLWFPGVIKAKWLVETHYWRTMDIILPGETFTVKGDQYLLQFEVTSNKDKKVVADLELGGLKLNRNVGTGSKTFVVTVDETRIEPALVALVFAIVEKFSFNDEAYKLAASLGHTAFEGFVITTLGKLLWRSL
jgi:hypothetical protein